MGMVNGDGDYEDDAGDDDDDGCSKSHQERDAGFLDGGIGGTRLSLAFTISKDLNLFQPLSNHYQAKSIISIKNIIC